MPQRQGTTTNDGARPDGSGAHAAVAGDFVLGAGWGTVATVTVLAGSTAVRGQITITASTTGVAQATATVVHTFGGGAWAAAPRGPFFQHTNDASLTAAAFWKAATPSTTACTWTYSILPVDTKIYIVDYLYIA
jgi:hypothetical protein